MNQILLIGRLTRNPEIRYSAGETQTPVARYTLAVDRKFKRQGDEQNADFIRCVCFSKLAEFAGQYLTKGVKIAVTGHIRTGNFVNKNGEKIFTTDVIVESQELVVPKSQSSAATAGSNVSNNNKFADNAVDDAAYQYFN